MKHYDKQKTKKIQIGIKRNKKRFKNPQTQSNTIKNVKNLYNSRQKIVDLLNDNSRIRSEPIYKAKQNEANKKTTGTGLQILKPKQMFQRLPIALAQIKAGNNSEYLLNEIRQIAYSLYQSKKNH